MPHKKDRHSQKRKKATCHVSGSPSTASHTTSSPKLELVLKCDSAGSLEAVREAILAAAPTGMKVNVFHAGIGMVNKSDIFMAESGSRLVVGFGVGVVQKIEPLLTQSGVEVRLYDVIYHLADDVWKIATSLIPQEEEAEKIIGAARVIALFKSSRKGIILGCKVEKGRLALGDHFRLITAMGPAYSGRIGSLHIEKDAVQAAKQGQQVGLKISDFKKASIGDLVESFLPPSKKKNQSWTPQGIVIHRLARP